MGIIKSIAAAVIAAVSIQQCTIMPCPLTADAASKSVISGDVNADGEFNAADLVALNSYILGRSAVLEAPEAGDLCPDGKLNVFDLIAMRKKLVMQMISAPFGNLPGLDYSSAAALGYISRAEYNYQITGELKESIEAKMGRPLDYSKDRFYLVRNEALGLEDKQHYLYDPASGEVYPITSETKVNCATWYWKGSKAALYELDDNMEKQNEFLDALEFYGITEIYYSIGPNNLVKKRDIVSKFVENAYKRDMRVYLLGGERDWLYEDSYESSIYNAFDKVEEYNSLVEYDSRIAGVSYDAEVWVNADYNWKNNNEARYQQIKYIAEAQRYAQSKELSAVYCLPFWLVQYYYTDDDGEVRNMYDSVTQIANDTILMIYRDTPEAILKLAAAVQSKADNTVLWYAEKNDCNLEIAVEINYTDEGAHVSFYDEEKENVGCVREALAKVREGLSEYKYRTTYAIHHAIVMYENYLSLEESDNA